MKSITKGMPRSILGLEYKREKKEIECTREKRQRRRNRSEDQREIKGGSSYLGVKE